MDFFVNINMKAKNKGESSTNTWDPFTLFSAFLRFDVGKKLTSSVRVEMCMMCHSGKNRDRYPQISPFVCP